MADREDFPSAITEAMRALQGIEGPETRYEVTTTGVRQFARAVGYADPVFYDQEEAQRRGYRDLPAPVGYLGTLVFHPATHDWSGQPRRQEGPRFESPYSLVLNGGTDVEYLGEICAGDMLTARTKLESVSERWAASLNSGMLIAVSATTFRNQHDQVVAVSRNTGLSYGPLKTARKG